jgi:DNA gyrase/topoisomerase IV subunit B
MMTNEEIKKKVQQTLEHIKRVQDNCFIIAYKLIDQNKYDLARSVIYRALAHDSSKFYRKDEFNSLVLGCDKDDELQQGIKNHQYRNDHHPECWLKGIGDMSDDALIEMICDWRSRSYERDMSLHEWIDENATKRWGFTKEDPIYKRIMYFVDLLVEKPY